MAECHRAQEEQGRRAHQDGSRWVRERELRSVAIVVLDDAAQLLPAADGAMELRLECLLEQFVVHAYSPVRA